MSSCVYCSTLATDPDKGPSRWARIVIASEQVLVCPDCQRDRPGWSDEAASCPVCASKRVSKTLGDLVCRSCGHSWGGREFTLD